MFFRFNETSKKCDAAKPYLIPVASGDMYSFVVPKSDIPEPTDAVLQIGFEDCAGNVYPVRDLPLTDGSECNYVDRTAVAYFKVKRISPFNCQTDEIIIYDANEVFDCTEKYPSAVTTPGDPQGFGSGLRAFYGIDPVPGYGQYFRSVQDYIDYLVFVSAIPGANSPYYGTMTDLGGGVVKWEIPEPDFITAFGHSPNEVKLSFCSNGGNTFEIEVLQDFKTCFTDDPNGLHGCGIAWARFTDTSSFPLRESQSIIFTYKNLDCAPENAIFELRWDDPQAAPVVDIDTYLNWLEFISGGWIIDHFISGTDVYVYFNVGFARDVGVELCGTFFKFCGYSYGGGYAYSAPSDPLFPVTQPVCCEQDTLCPPRYDYWFATACLPDLPLFTSGRFFITKLAIAGNKYYSNQVIYKQKCNSSLIRFKNRQNFAGQPYNQNPLFYNQFRLGVLLQDLSTAKNEVISRNSAGTIRKIYSQTLLKYLLTTDYFDYISHIEFALALEHDEFEIYDPDAGEWTPYICEGEYKINTVKQKPFAGYGRAEATLTKANKINTNTYC